MNGLDPYSYEFHAGYILDVVEAFVSERGLGKRWFWNETLAQVSVFDVQSNCSLSVDETPDPIICVLDGLISRGLPTRPSTFIEKEFSKKLLHLPNHDKHPRGKLCFSSAEAQKILQQNNIPMLMFNALCLVDPRHKALDRLDFESNAERQFLNNTLPNLGLSSLVPLIETQRPLDTICEGYGNEQRTDFAIELPATGKDKLQRKIVIEIDGPTHERKVQKILDAMRESEASKDNWLTARISVNKLDSPDDSTIEVLKKFANHPIVKATESNIAFPLWDTAYGQLALTLTLEPIGIARIQKVLSRLILAGHLKLDDAEWNIAIHERDVKCAKFAIEDFINHLEQLFRLEGKGRELPTINTDITCTKEFARPNDQTEFSSVNHDILIDISLLSRSDVRFDYDPFENEVGGRRVTIRSSYSQRKARHHPGSTPVKYEVDKSGFKQPLTHILQWVFRLKKFRKKQVKIIKLALSGKSVIALLQTGGGKSLTYQLPALLQPGLAVVVDPIKALMQDQIESLERARIDATTFINSDIPAKEKELRMVQMANGQLKFVFVSPERFQIESFRSKLQQLSEGGIRQSGRVNYAVIDESHCVSEWGHDFRTSYLSLGRNLRKYCKPFLFEGELPILALTGTASYDVLRDVQKELDLQSDSQIVRPDPKSSERENLKYSVVGTKSGSTNSKNDFFRIKANGEAKHRELIRFIERFTGEDPEEYFASNKASTNCAIVFCPYVSEATPFGVISVKNELSRKFPGLNNNIEAFAGNLNQGETRATGDTRQMEIQRSFKDNEITILAATKAFGMGVDKPNIRLSIHLNMPSSIEAFCQEAGRAGRDEKDADCVLLFSDNRGSSPPSPAGTSIDADIMLRFHRSSFKGIEREMTHLREVLNKVRWPIRRRTDKLNQMIGAELDRPIRVSPWFKKDKRLYVNDEAGEKLGYIDLTSLKRYPESKIENSSEVIIAVLKGIKSLGYDPRTSSIDWFDEEAMDLKTDGDGILDALQSMEVGSRSTFLIGFQNNVIEKLTAITLDGILNSYEIEKAHRYSENADDFIQKVASALKGKSLNDRQKLALEKSFDHIRLQSDTDKAIYRLLLLGVVEDYTKDYIAGVVTVTLHRQPYENYRDALEKYLTRWEKATLVLEHMKKLENLNGPPLLENCLLVLLQFVYQNIAAKRVTAIDNMANAALSGIDDPVAFRTRLINHFTAKYTDQLQSLVSSSDYSDIKEIIDVVDASGALEDNLRHLQGACDRLLESYPDRGSLFLLRSYAIFGLAKNMAEMQEGYLNYQRSWPLLIEDKTITESEALKHQRSFRQHLIEQHPELGKFFMAKFLGHTTSWVTNFRERITG